MACFCALKWRVFVRVLELDGAADLEQKLIFHDPLNWFYEQIGQLKAMTKSQPDILQHRRTVNMYTGNY